MSVRRLALPFGLLLGIGLGALGGCMVPLQIFTPTMRRIAREYLDHANVAFIRLNLVLLLVVSFIPFPTKLVATYLQAPGERAAAARAGQDFSNPTPSVPIPASSTPTCRGCSPAIPGSSPTPGRWNASASTSCSR